MTNKLLEKLENIQTRKDFSEFITCLSKDFEQHKEDWENPNLLSFLEAMSSWVEDMDGYYKSHQKPFSENQPWKIFAEILYAAKIYE